MENESFSGTADIVLVQPNVVWVYDPFEHLGLGYLAASLRQAGFRVAIVDAVLEQLSMSALCRRVRAFNPKIVGVTLISHGYKVTIRLLEQLRRDLPEARFVGGGHFATFAADKIMADTGAFDAIALGEADRNFVDYCRAQIGGVGQKVAGIHYPDGPARAAPQPVDIAALPHPARDYLPLALSRGAEASVTSSRGCYARCTFCTVHNFYERQGGKRWFGRPIPDIINELRDLHSRHAISHFNFVDDNFVGAGKAGRQRVFDFADAYRVSGLPMTFHIDCRASDVSEDMIAALVDVGLVSVFMGIESVSRQDLIDYRKGLKTAANWRAIEIIKAHKLTYTLAMIMFNPRTTRQSILDNVNYLKSVGYYPRNPISILNIYEGTDLIKIYAEYMSGPFWDYRFRFADEAVAQIHRASLEFCKNSLPLERILAGLGPSGQDLRLELNRIRLSALGDLAKHWQDGAAEAILAPWQTALDRLRRAVRVDVVASAKAARFGQERLYLQSDAVP